MSSAEGAVIALRVFPDYAADPVWDHPGMVDLNRLPWSDGPVTALREWAREWTALVGVEIARYEMVDAAAHEAWQRVGRRLSHRLQNELGRAMPRVAGAEDRHRRSPYVGAHERSVSWHHVGTLPVAVVPECFGLTVHDVALSSGPSAVTRSRRASSQCPCVEQCRSEDRMAAV